MSAVVGQAGGLRAGWNSGLARVRVRWRALGLRERRLISAAVTLVGLFLLWTVAIQPAWRTSREAPKQLDQLDAQLQQMRRQAAEVRELRDAPVVGTADAVAALKAASERLGGQGRLQVLGDRATLTLNGASGEQLRRWLAEARSGARARPIEATLTRAGTGYGGTIIVALPAAGS